MIFIYIFQALNLIRVYWSIFLNTFFYYLFSIVPITERIIFQAFYSTKQDLPTCPRGILILILILIYRNDAFPFCRIGNLFFQPYKFFIFEVQCVRKCQITCSSIMLDYYCSPPTLKHFLLFHFVLAKQPLF